LAQFFVLARQRLFLPNLSSRSLGSGRVGKIVAAAAAKFPTPVTLEVRRGKSPVIIEVLIAQPKKFYPETVNEHLVESMITSQAFKRVNGFIDATKGEVVIGGETIEEKKYIAPNNSEKRYSRGFADVRGNLWPYSAHIPRQWY
jgi:acyl-CoA reductase-like NAD-dependent aldehyde dehydrogenase